MKNVFANTRGNNMLKKILNFGISSFSNQLNKYNMSVLINKNENEIKINNLKLDKSFIHNKKLRINELSPLSNLHYKLNINQNGFIYKRPVSYFSTNISLNEVEEKKKAAAKKDSNNSNTDSKKLEEEKIEQQEHFEDKLNKIKINALENNNNHNNTIVSNKINTVNLNKNNHISNNEEIKSEDKEKSYPIKFNNLKFLKKLSPEFKVVITKKIKKIIDNKKLKSLYNEGNTLGNSKLAKTDPFNDKLIEELSSEEKIDSDSENALADEPSSLTKSQVDIKKNIYNNIAINKAEKKDNFNHKVITSPEAPPEFKTEQAYQYRKSVENVYGLLKEFDLIIFKNVIHYVQENSLEDGLIMRKIETILIDNLPQIDCNTKGEAVFILAKSLQKKKIKYNEETWYKIYKDFVNLSELSVLNFKDYYNFILSFEKIKNLIFAYRSRYSVEFEKFINYETFNFLNAGKINFNNLDDIILLSSLIHAKIFTINNINDSVWMNLNQLICKNSLRLSINTLLVTTSLLTNLSEVSMKAPILFSETIQELSKFMTLIFNNFEFLDDLEKMQLINFSDNLFNFYLIFIHNNNAIKANYSGRSNRNSDNSSSCNFEENKLHSWDMMLNFDSFLIKNLIKIYTEKIKLQNNFNFFHELRILIFLSKELKYFDNEFWGYCGNTLKSFLKVDFMTKIADILPKRLSNSSSSKSRASALEIEEMSKLFYYGVIIEVFSTVRYYNEDFWDVIFEKFDEIVPISKKDPLIFLQFISLHCKKLYKNKRYEHIYDKLINKFSPEYKNIFSNRDILDFLISVNFHNAEFDREKNNKLILDLLNPLGHLNDEPSFGLNSPLYARSYSITNAKEGLRNESAVFSIIEKENNPSSDKPARDPLPLENESDAIAALSSVNLENNPTNDSGVEAAKKDKKKSIYPNTVEEAEQTNSIMLLITYLNLLWNKNIFEEKVNFFFNIQKIVKIFRKHYYILLLFINNRAIISLMFFFYHDKI